MALPTPVLSYGLTTLQLGEAPRIVLRSDGFDEGQFEFIGGSEASLYPGTQVPGYAGMYIQEDSVTDHSGYFEHSVRATGLRNGATRKIATTASSSEDGFDTGSETWIATSGGSFSHGRSHALHTGLYCVTISEKRSPVAQCKVFDLQFKGIKDSSRPARYKFSTSTREAVLENFTNGFSGGDSLNPHRWSIMHGAPMLEKSFLSSSPPDFTKVGIQASFGEPFPNTTALNYFYSDSALTWQWPNGWVLGAINAEQVPNKNAYFIVETYVKRDRIIA